MVKWLKFLIKGIQAWPENQVCRLLESRSTSNMSLFTNAANLISWRAAFKIQGLIRIPCMIKKSFNEDACESGLCIRGVFAVGLQ